jgi:solute carrier family 9B (sodium/hydrogen exchanger), member 1/2
MALSLAIILFLGIVIYQLFSFVKVPGFLGVLFLGMAIGPFGTDWIDDGILSVSSDLRNIALIIILLRAGFGLHRNTLKMIGMPALRLGVLPAMAEGFTVMVAAYMFLGFHWAEAGMLGFIVAAVSPAVIIPKMLHFIEIGKGSDKGIPAMILAGASIDDVVAITFFSAFAGYMTGAQIDISAQFFIIPLSVILGAVAGVITGAILLFLFVRIRMRNTMKILVILACSIFLTSLEHILENMVPVASLLGIMVIGFVIYDRRPALGKELSGKLSRLWVFAEIMLFFLVGAQVNFALAADAGSISLLIIIIGLLARSAGVYISLLGTRLSAYEKLFCVISYSPKATVQAAIGSIPLMMGTPHGGLILTIAVLSIILTAPIGAIATQAMGKKVLKDAINDNEKLI